MKLAALFLLLSVSFCAAQRDKAGQRPVLDVRDNGELNYLNTSQCNKDFIVIIIITHEVTCDCCLPALQFPE